MRPALVARGALIFLFTPTASPPSAELQARAGERGFDRRECTQKYTTKAKRKFNELLRRKYAERQLFTLYKRSKYVGYGQ